MQCFGNDGKLQKVDADDNHDNVFELGSWFTEKWYAHLFPVQTELKLIQFRQ